MTLPRVVTHDPELGRLVFSPAPELSSLRTRQLVNVSGTTTLVNASWGGEGWPSLGRQLEIEATFSPSGQFGVCLGVPHDGGSDACPVEVLLSVANNAMTASVRDGVSTSSTVVPLRPEEPVTVHAWTDQTVAEVYLQGGRAVFSGLAVGRDGGEVRHNVSVYSTRGAATLRLAVHSVGSAWG